MTNTTFITRYPNLAAFLMNAKQIAARCVKNSIKIMPQNLSILESIHIIDATYYEKNNILKYIQKDLIKLIIDCFNDMFYGEQEFCQDIINAYSDRYETTEIDKNKYDRIVFVMLKENLVNTLFRPIDTLICPRLKNNSFQSRNTYFSADSRFKAHMLEFILKMDYNEYYSDFIQ